MLQTVSETDSEGRTRLTVRWVNTIHVVRDRTGRRVFNWDVYVYVFCRWFLQKTYEWVFVMGSGNGVGFYVYVYFSFRLTVSIAWMGLLLRLFFLFCEVLEWIIGRLQPLTCEDPDDGGGPLVDFWIIGLTDCAVDSQDDGLQRTDCLWTRGILTIVDLLNPLLSANTQTLGHWNAVLILFC